jgi:CheY-like chemotaxis protein
VPKRVLVIDDDDNVVKFFSLALSENGYEPVGASDGGEGLEKVKEVQPDLIVLDVMMPRRSGFVLFKQLRKAPEYANIPVIMVTGVADELEKQMTEQGAGEDAFDGLKQSLAHAIQNMREEGLVKPEKFVDKPVDPEDLVAAVRELIGE